MTTRLDIRPEEVARMVRKIQALLDEVGFSLMEKLECYGALTLMEGINHGFTDKDLNMMYEAMRDRFLTAAMELRCARSLLAVLREHERMATKP